MRRIVLVLFVFMMVSELFGQSIPVSLQGQVSFVSSQNVYVKFKSTEGIEAGDTLFMPASGNLKPALIVNNLSSTSCVSTILPEINLSVSDLILARPSSPEINKTEKQIKVETPVITANTEADSAKITNEKKSEYTQRIKGSISAYSYSDFSNTAGDNLQRFRYTFSLDAKNMQTQGFLQRVIYHLSIKKVNGLMYRTMFSTLSKKM